MKPDKSNGPGESLAERSESIVQINPLELDRECVRLPSDYVEVALEAADLRKRLDELKAEQEVLEADLAKDIRSNPGSYGLEKVTEAAVSACITANSKVQTLAEKTARAKHRLDIAQAVISALEAKKRSLTLLVELHGMSYFAGPNLSDKGRQVVERMTKENVRPRRRAMEQD